MFTLQSFSKQYIKSNQVQLNCDDFANRLWGDWYHNEATNTFSKLKPSNDSLRTFCLYVLEPLYKIYAHSIAGASIRDCCTNQKIQNESLKQLLSTYCCYPHGLVDMLVTFIPSPLSFSQMRLHEDDDIAHLNAFSADSELIIKITKLYHSSNDNDKVTSLVALGRIFSGKINLNEKVKVLTESSSSLISNNEEMGVAEIEKISVYLKDSYIHIPYAIAGNWVLLDGVDMPIKKVATITHLRSQNMPIVCDQISSQIQSVVKLAIEPLNPISLPQVVESLRIISKLYPAAISCVEDSGEHIILAPGELYLDCIMHDLRYLYGKVEIKVADPSVQFNETIVDHSKIKSITETPNKKNKISILSEPLDVEISQDIEDKVFGLKSNKNDISLFFRQKYNWDVLASRSIWAFGPNDRGPNILMNDTFVTDDAESELYQVKKSIIQGFQWACREGPLCEEPLRNCNIKIIDTSISKLSIHRGGGQIIPTVRRGVYSSFLSSSPRIMEPFYLVEIQTPADCMHSIYPVLMRRRGHIFQDHAKPGAPFFTLRAYLPFMDSFGFEVDIRSYSQGQVFCQQIFDHWSIVPGDPLDKNVIIHPLEPVPVSALARDSMVKTRRRKGLIDDVFLSYTSETTTN